MNPHLARMGAVNVPRAEFVALVERNNRQVILTTLGREVVERGNAILLEVEDQNSPQLQRLMRSSLMDRIINLAIACRKNVPPGRRSG